MSRIQMLYESSQKDLQFLETDNQKLKSMLQDTRGQLLSQEAKSKDYFQQLKTSQGTIQKLENEVFKAKSHIQEKTDALRMTNKEKLDAEREAAGLFQLSEQLNQANLRNQSLSA